MRERGRSGTRIEILEHEGASSGMASAGFQSLRREGEMACDIAVLDKRGALSE
jgi:hypothetical protein